MEDEGRLSKKQKVLVETETLSVLKASYLNHFSDYSRGRKTVTQKLPGKVWKLVFEDFLTETKRSCLEKGISFCEDKLPSSRTLQDALRGCISTEDTGNADIKGAEKVILQSEDVLQQLKQTDGHARRSMIKMRNEMISTEIRSPTSQQNQAPTKAATAKPAPLETRSQIMARTADSLESMAEVMKEGSISTIDLQKSQHLLAKENFSLYEADLARKQKAHSASIKAKETETKAKELQSLAFLLEHGVITKEELMTKAKAIADL